MTIQRDFSPIIQRAKPAETVTSTPIKVEQAEVIQRSSAAEVVVRSPADDGQSSAGGPSAPGKAPILQDGNQRGTPTTIDLGDGANVQTGDDMSRAIADVLGAVLGAIGGSSQPSTPSAPRKREEPVKAGGSSGPSFGDWLGRLANAVVDLGKTWGNWNNTSATEFNFGHDRVDGELWGQDADGDITWADNGAKVSPDQVNAMPEPQREEFFRRVGIEPVPERQVGAGPNPAVTEPPEGVSVPGKQVLGGGEGVESAAQPAIGDVGTSEPEAAAKVETPADPGNAVAGSEPPAAEEKPAPAAEDKPAPAAEDKPAPALPLGKKQTILSVADPHITSADGLKYDNKLPGDFILASSNRGNFDVQVRQGSLPGDSGVWQTAAAVKTDGHVVQYDAQRNMVNIDGKDHAFKPGQRIALSDGAYVQMSREANPGDGRTRGFDRVQVHTAQGDDVYMLNFARGKNHQMDVRVDVSGTRLDGEVSGIGGRVDRDTSAANDLVMRDGTVTTKANEDAAANSWRVQSGESILP